MTSYILLCYVTTELQYVTKKKFSLSTDFHLSERTARDRATRRHLRRQGRGGGPSRAGHAAKMDSLSSSCEPPETVCRDPAGSGDDQQTTGEEALETYGCCWVRLAGRARIQEGRGGENSPVLVLSCGDSSVPCLLH